MAAVSPESILRELDEVWASLGSEPGSAVLRACCMTLTVVAEENDDAQAIGETLAALMSNHPSRAIVVLMNDREEPQLSARASAQCWRPFGQRRQICCEQIEIRASRGSLEQLRGLVQALTVPDLPAFVWLRSTRLPALAALGRKAILDSRGSAELPDAGRFPAPIADLAWTSLTPWRRQISRLFDAGERLEQLPRFTEVQVALHSSVSARYLGAWLVDGIERAGGKPALRLAPADGGERVELRGATVIEQSGGFPALSNAALLAEEFALEARDPVFERSLARARGLALSS